MADTTRKQVFISFDALMDVMCDQVVLEQFSPLRALLRYGADTNAIRAYRATAAGITPSELGLAIRVEADPEALTLSIHNDGPGLSRGEIELGIRDIEAIVDARTAGLSGAREADLVYNAVKSFAQATLWSIAASEEIIIDSLTADEDARAWRWRYSGGDTYELMPGERTTVGTTISLRLNPEYSHLCDPETLADELRRYGEYLQYPILWEGRQINTMSPPWHQDAATVEDHAAFLRNQLSGRPAPLLVIPVKTSEPGLEIRGVLWVPGEDLRLFDRTVGEVDLYDRRLLVEEGRQDILPDWVRFLRGIIDIGGLSSRDRPSRFDRQKLKETVETVILDSLSRLVVTDPERFMRVAEHHDQLLKLAAVHNDRMFEIVADQLSFRTNHGPRTLPEYLAEVQQFTGEPVIEYQMVPFEASPYTLHQPSRPVIDASAGLDEAVLEEYDRRNPAVQLVKIDAPNRPVAEEVGDDRYQPLVELFLELDPPVTARPARFQSTSVAAVFSAVEQDRMRSQLQQLFMLSQVSGAIPPEARDALQRAISAKSSEPPPDVLHFNIDCPAIEALLEAIKAGKKQAAYEVAEIIVMRARLLGGNVDASRLGEYVNRIIARVLEDTPEPSD